MIIKFQLSDGSPVEIDIVEGQIEDLGQLAEDGDGMYHTTKPVWGEVITDVTKKISIESSSGGLIFFDDSDFSPVRLEKTLEILGMIHPRPVKEYSAYILHSTSPLKDGYLTQLRIVSAYALKYYYKADAKKQTKQKVDIHSMIRGFIEHEKARYGYVELERGMLNPTLYEKIGASGDEEGMFGLGFGLLVENSYYQIYRVWSRPVFYSK